MARFQLYNIYYTIMDLFHFIPVVIISIKFKLYYIYVYPPLLGIILLWQ